MGQTVRLGLTYKLPYHMQNRWLVGTCCTAKETHLCSVMTQRSGMGGGCWRVVREGGDTCIFIADSFCCTVETKTTL